MFEWCVYCGRIAMSYRFIADVHLGRLARLLRLLGFDTWYPNVATPPQLVALVAEEDRLRLSRSGHMPGARNTRTLRISSESASQQLKEVMQACGISHQAHPFSRCLVCNGRLTAIEKTAVVDQLDPNTARYYAEFRR